MKLVKCSKAGHFYDGERFAECPHCATPGDPHGNMTAPAEPKTENETMTTDLSALLNKEEPSAKATETGSLRNQVSAVTVPANGDDPKTVGFFKATIGLEPVVGWLVCVEGPHFGQDFRLKAGRNFIGRAQEMDVVIWQDETVSRDRHAIMLYEPKKNLFIVQPGSSKELSYLNDNVILNASEAKSNDIILIGKTKLMLIPCCSDAFTWDMVKPDTKEKE